MTGVRFRVLLLVISAAAASACGGSAALSPTAPSQTGAGPSGAVIIGQVSGAAATSTPRDTRDTLAEPSFSTLAASSITVKITGTNISTTTDGQGQFTLTGVPPGDVQLEFTGQGSSAKVVISGVSAQDEIRIAVTINGNNARVDSEQRHKGDDRGNDQKDQNEISGPVASLGGTCPNLSFILHGARVVTTARTAFEGGTCASLKNGVQVEVTGQRGTDGTLTITRVKVNNRAGNEDEIKGRVAGLSGTCPSLAFTVGTTKVVTTSSTVFEDVTCALVQNGATVELKGQRQADGTVTATRVSRED